MHEHFGHKFSKVKTSSETNTRASILWPLAAPACDVGSPSSGARKRCFGYSLNSDRQSVQSQACNDWSTYHYEHPWCLATGDSLFTGNVPVKHVDVGQCCFVAKHFTRKTCGLHWSLRIRHDSGALWTWLKSREVVDQLNDYQVVTDSPVPQVIL
jgi:hypothetical protein